MPDVVTLHNYQITMCKTRCLGEIHCCKEFNCNLCVGSQALHTSVLMNGNYLQKCYALFSSVGKWIITNFETHPHTPSYLHSMLAILLPSMSLISNKGITLMVSRVKTNTGIGAFHSCSLSNNLALSVHSSTSNAILRKCLKTHLFDLAIYL